MPAGLQVQTPTGVFQIDGENRNLVLREKGTVSLDDQEMGLSSTPPKYKATFARDDLVTPVIAIQPAGGGSACLWSMVKAGDTWTFTIMSTQQFLDVEWFLFDVPVESADPDPGDVVGRIYNAAGDLIFDFINAKPFRPVALVDESTPFTAPVSGREYAVVSSGSGYRFAYTDLGPSFTPGMQTWQLDASFSNAVLQDTPTVYYGIQPVTFDGFVGDYPVGSPPGPDYTPQAVTGLVIDVTHF